MDDGSGDLRSTPAGYSAKSLPASPVFTKRKPGEAAFVCRETAMEYISPDGECHQGEGYGTRDDDAATSDDEERGEYMAENFRVKKGFTVVQNSVARDLTISEKALGLYVRIQCWITLPNPVSKSFLMAHCNGREKAFDSCWKELQRLGYLKTYQYRAPGAVTFDTEHELLEVAEPDTPYFYIVTKPQGKITTVWYYDESGKAQTKNGLDAYMEGDRVEDGDRFLVLGQLREETSPPQNGGGCSGPPRERPSRVSSPWSMGAILKTEDNPTDNPLYKHMNNPSAADDGKAGLPSALQIGEDQILGATETDLQNGALAAERLFALYTLRKPTRADVTSLMRAVYVREGEGIRPDEERMKLLAYAFDRAREAGCPGAWNYIFKVLARLKDRGIETLEQAEEYDDLRIMGELQ